MPKTPPEPPKPEDRDEGDWSDEVDWDDAQRQGGDFSGPEIPEQRKE